MRCSKLRCQKSVKLQHISQNISANTSRAGNLFQEAFRRRVLSEAEQLRLVLVIVKRQENVQSAEESPKLLRLVELDEDVWQLLYLHTMYQLNGFYVVNSPTKSSTCCYSSLI